MFDFKTLLSQAPFVRRFVAGTKAEDAIAAARRANEKGLGAILDFLGEDVSTPAAARRAADEYIHLLELIDQAKVRASVSLKVSQMGILVSREICLDNLRRIATEAARLKIFVWFDMEGSALTRSTIDVFETLRDDFNAVGLCLQAYLVRTGGDLDHLSKKPFHLRLCKGAYNEPPTVAYASKAAVEGSYRMLLMKAMNQTARGLYPAFATHDTHLIQSVKLFAEEKGISKKAFEFQMLYGIQNEHLMKLAQEGYNACVYIPYGTHWLPYFTRRLRERKENVYFLMRNVFRA
jgi:proline dehydrogenase